MGKLFGTDGIRGVVGSELTGDLACLVGGALISTLPKREKNTTVLIGTDTRLSSDMLAMSVAEGICRAGGDAVMLGVCSTPAVAYLVTRQGFDAGVMISASHNPWEYNGIKIFGADGFKLSDFLEEKIEKKLLSGKEIFSDIQKSGSVSHFAKGIDCYIEHIIESSAVMLDDLRIGIDCANGSASVSAERIFKRLGAECIMLANRPDGMNINRDCGSTHLDSLCTLVKEKGLNLGIAFDGDGDRCLAVDERGCEVDGDYILAILAQKLKSEGRLNKNTLVGTVMSNLGLAKFCENEGMDFLSTKVGDRYVLEAMNEGGLSLGGEQSGHIIIRELATTGDGQLTAVALLSHIKASGKSLSALANIMKKYPQYMINIHADADEKLFFKSDEKIKQIINESEKEMGSHGRILIRPSGTEPLIRIMTEGDDEAISERICKELAERISARLGQRE